LEVLVRGVAAGQHQRIAPTTPPAPSARTVSPARTTQRTNSGGDAAALSKF